MPATSGQSIIAGQSVAGLRGKARKALWRHAQMVFQDPYSSLNPRMTVQDALAEPLRNFGIARGSEAERRVREALDACGLSASAMTRYPREFSGGQRQRIGIARALIVRPNFIVADEPVSALDVSIQAQIINLLQDLKTEFGLTYLFIAHDLAVIRHVSDRVAVMYRGKLVETAPADALYARPLHPYTQLLLRSVPVPDTRAEADRRRLAQGAEVTNPAGHRRRLPVRRALSDGAISDLRRAGTNRSRRDQATIPSRAISPEVKAPQRWARATPVARLFMFIRTASVPLAHDHERAGRSRSGRA